MNIKLLHQCGHNSIWNIDSFLKDHCGDGLIVSPVHMAKSTVEKLGDNLKKSSVFDPQYYLPNSQKKKLKSYDFFPETISGGFSTTDFAAIALESARKCVEFQIEHGFDSLIIPARHFTDMVPDFIEKQNAYTVHPFLQAISEQKIKKKIYLTLSLTSPMLVHDNYLVDILNWVTSFQEIDGIYLLVDDPRQTKQIQSAHFMQRYMQTAKELIDANLSVIVGHANTEGLLFSLIDGCQVTFGAYENTRMFSVDKFVVSDEDRRGPKARIYLPGLLNWIHFTHANEIRNGLTDVWNEIYFETDYAERAFEAAAVKEPHFSSPDLYKHFFLSYQNQIHSLRLLSVSDRYIQLREWLTDAQEYYDKISDWPLDLDRHGRGDHIQSWLDAINWYKRNYII